MAFEHRSRSHFVIYFGARADIFRFKAFRLISRLSFEIAINSVEKSFHFDQFDIFGRTQKENVFVTFSIIAKINLFSIIERAFRKQQTSSISLFIQHIFWMDKSFYKTPNQLFVPQAVHNLHQRPPISIF